MYSAIYRKVSVLQGFVELGWVSRNLPTSKCTEVQGVSVEVLEMGQVLVLELLSPVLAFFLISFFLIFAQIKVKWVPQGIWKSTL